MSVFFHMLLAFAGKKVPMISVEIEKSVLDYYDQQWPMFESFVCLSIYVDTKCYVQTLYIIQKKQDPSIMSQDEVMF